jgi:hypothetical protein
MGLPREYLEFAVWYLQSKGYIARADSLGFTLTAKGEGFVERERANIKVLDKLLPFGSDLPRQVPGDPRA